MNPRTLRILALLSVLALGVAWWMAGRGPSSASATEGALLPDLKASINEVARIEIDDGKQPLSFERKGTSWVDPSRGGYPVKTSEVNRLLLGLMGLQKKEAKTSRAERHGELKLALTGDEQQRGQVLRLWLAGKEQAGWEIVIGESKWSPVQGLYARLLAENQCWFVAGEIQLPYQPTAWLDKEVTNVNASDVERMLLVRGENRFTMTRPDDATPWALAEMPEGRTLKEFSPFGSLANALGYLNFEDVAPATDPRFAGGADLAAEFGFFNGASIRLEGWSEGEGEDAKLWVRLSSAPPTAALPADPANAPLDTPRGPSADTLATWEGKWMGWVYQLPQWKGKALLQGLEDWLEPLVEEPPSAPEDEASPSDE